MYIYCKNGKNRIVHTSNCFHISKCNKGDTSYFGTLDAAYNNGYRLCKHCDILSAQYQREMDEIKRYCREKPIVVQKKSLFILVMSPLSMWMIVLSPDNEHTCLYHKNFFDTEGTNLSSITGYHLQNVSKNSIVEYLEYILEHDKYRRQHPYTHPKKAVYKPLEEKSNSAKKSAGAFTKPSAKKAAKLAKKKANIERKNKACNVLRLIDSLQYRT